MEEDIRRILTLESRHPIVFVHNNPNGYCGGVLH
jgi:hypothetical protein